MPCQIYVYKLVNIVTQLFIYMRSQRGVMYMKTTTLAIIVILTAMILVTAGAFSSTALAAKGSSDSGGGTSSKDTGTSSKDTGTSSKDTGTSSKDTGTSSKDTGTSSTSGGTSSSVGKPLKALISCLTSASKLTGTLPTRAQFTTCESQANFGTLGGSTIGSSTSGSAKSTGSASASGGGGFVQSPSSVIGPSFLGSKGGKASSTAGTTSAGQ
jgi:trimeric autotransporter adhesin